jgi:hypothetical protein
MMLLRNASVASLAQFGTVLGAGFQPAASREITSTIKCGCGASGAYARRQYYLPNRWQLLVYQAGRALRPVFRF